MSVNVNDVTRKLSPAERKKVEDRAAAIIAEEVSLRDLRKARKLTQARQDARHRSRQRFAARKTQRPLNRDTTKSG